MSVVTELEKTLVQVNKGLPALPVKAKEFIAKYVPIFTLIGGVLSLLAAVALWRAVDTVDQYVDFANNISRAYGGGEVTSGSLGLFGWIALVSLLVQGVIYVMAYTPLKARKKKGWDLMFYASLVGVGVAVISLFVDYLGAGNFVQSLIGSAIGLYFLFQIRDRYMGSTKEKKVEAKAKPASKK